uniref:Gamma-glutamyltranspeptidase 1 n=1 Tax=Macrostomum lignano TaxID=282301 RepID=A0A1I8G9W0_9PLAT
MHPSQISKYVFALLAAVITALTVLVIVFVSLYLRCINDEATNKTETSEWQNNCVSDSTKDIYQYNAISADSAVCSTIGDYVLNILGGNAMDAGVATLLCVGVSNFQSAGIGGGSFLVYYNRSSRTASAYNYRETAPAAAHRDMYSSASGLPSNASLYGGLAIGVPGEVAGLAAAHAAHGRLPWRSVVEPVSRVLRKGQRVSRPLADAIASKYPQVPDVAPFKELKDWMVNPATGKPYKEGDVLVDTKLADTMDKIANDPQVFYNGSLADDIVQEVLSAGGNITNDDLLNYQPRRLDPLMATLPSKGLTLYSLPPPSSGAVLSLILGIMDGYAGDSAKARSTKDGYVNFLHRLVESFKFAYAKRSGLGDAVFVNVTELVANMTSSSYASELRSRITDDATHDVNYYGPMFEWKEDSGTTHVSLVDSDGNAISVTATINTYFGSMVRGARTGIFYNNEMDDFSQPNKTNFFGLPASPTNFIEPGKRPMSSMAPTILVDSSGAVQFVSGAAGGSRITTAIAYMLARQLYLNETVKAAVDSYRLHHQLVPNFVTYNPDKCDIIKSELRRKGHAVQPSSSLSVIEAVQRLPNGKLQANWDFRKPRAAFSRTCLLAAVDNYTLQTEETPEWQKNCVSDSGTDIYQYNAVSSDSAVCSTIGDYVLNVLGGNAMDAGVATVLCVGVSNFQSAGIGGGSFLVYYNSSTRTATAFDFRESAPAAAHRDMYSGLPSNASRYGGLAIGVPGEAAGLAAAHAAYGRLPWRSVVEPSTLLLRRGQRVPPALAKAINTTANNLIDEAPFNELKKWLVNPATGNPYQEGDLLVDNKLADTLEKIANDPSTFYNGSLAKDILQEVLAAGGNITKEDLSNYRLRQHEALTATLPSKGQTLYSPPPPSSGAVLSLILGIMDGYAGDSAKARSTKDGYVNFLHRLVESFKFAYAKRSGLGDAAFVNVTELVANMTSSSYASELRSRITDDATHDVNYYGPMFEWKEDSGTTHVSLVDSDGNAIAITSSINTHFGSRVRGNRTGIFYNNVMDDFSQPNKTSNSTLPPAPTNFIEPGKRPMSSMAPTILVDSSGAVQFVSGASGGSRITTAVAYALARQLYLNETVKAAVDSYRLHHQLVPNWITYDKDKCDLPEVISLHITKVTFAPHRDA